MAKFPDLSGDGKITQKDILMGKGVINKKKMMGGPVNKKKMAYGGKAMKTYAMGGGMRKAKTYG